MKSIKFKKKGRIKEIYLQEDRYRCVPNQSKFEKGTVYFKYKGDFYVKD